MACFFGGVTTSALLQSIGSTSAQSGSLLTAASISASSCLFLGHASQRAGRFSVRAGAGYAPFARRASVSNCRDAVDSPLGITSASTPCRRDAATRPGMVLKGPETMTWREAIPFNHTRHGSCRVCGAPRIKTCAKSRRRRIGRPLRPPSRPSPSNARRNNKKRPIAFSTIAARC